jgi:transposase
MTVEDRLSAHPGIKVVAHDRGGPYGQAATPACPSAKQVADRWHLIENASATFLDAVHRSMSRSSTAIGATTISPVLLTYAERRQHNGYLRRQEANAIIRRVVSGVVVENSEPVRV